MTQNPALNLSNTGIPSNSWSLESERGLLCAALNENRADVIREISAHLLATDFYEEVHQNVWRCRSSLADAGVAHDMAAIMDCARKLGLFLGGSDYVLNLAQDETLKVISDLALHASAKRVKDYSGTRAFIETLDTASVLARSGTQTHEELVGYVSDAIENIRSASDTRSSGPVHIMQYVAAVIEQIGMRMDGEAPQNAVTTGFDDVDHMITGLADGDLVLLAARPSMGKTAISLALAEAAATVGDRHVLYFSTEQGGNALAYRMVASKSRVDATNMRRAEFAHGEFERMIEGATAVGDWPVHIDETSSITLPEIRARSRIHKNKYGKIMIVVDYLQRVAPHRAADPRVIIGEISTGLKNLAKELQCPVVALAQLNRELEKRANKRPMLSDLGESGKLEQDADIVLFLYRDDYYNPDTKEPGISEVIVGKNRDGAIGVAKLGFDKRTQHYESMSHGHN